MMKFRKDAFPVNQLATALKKQGKDKEATELFRQVADRFAMSERAEDRFETIPRVAGFVRFSGEC